MSWLTLAILIAAGSVVFGGFALLAVRFLSQREPYKNFLSLRNRRKLTFVRFLIQDPRVPLYVKAVPFLLLLYLISPIDIIPDFIPVLGYMDDLLITLLALVLILKLTSGPVVDDLIQRAREADATPKRAENRSHQPRSCTTIGESNTTP